MDGDASMDRIGAGVVVTRPKSGSSRLRAFRIEIDGRDVGALRAGGTLNAEIEPGVHEVRVRADWCASRPVNLELAGGETADLVCRADHRDVFRDLWTVTFGNHEYPRLELAH